MCAQEEHPVTMKAEKGMKQQKSRNTKDAQQTPKRQDRGMEQSPVYLQRKHGPADTFTSTF